MLHRYLSLQDASKAREKADGDLLVDMAFSSEEPYERWWGIEILDHAETSIRLGRLNDGAPLLFNHNWNDLRGVHVPGSVKIGKDRVLRGKVRVTSVTAVGRDTIGLVESGVLAKASVGYQIYRVIEQTTQKGLKVERELDGALFERILTRSDSEARGDLEAFRRALDQAAGALERDKDEPSIYRVVDWEPIENSLVTIPADPTVGVGRGLVEQQLHEVRNPRAASSTADSAISRKGTSMERSEAERLAAEAEAARKQKEEQDRQAREQLEREAREKLEQRSAADLEQSRVRAIENLAKANSIADNIRDLWVRQGYSLEQVSNDILKILEERGKFNPQPASRLGLTANETQRFSLSRAILAASSKDNDWSKAGFELECSRAVAQKLGKIAESHKFYVPFEVLQRPIDEAAQRAMAAMGRRDLTVAAAGAGGYLVSTDNVGFIEILRNRSVVFMMGARRLSGLQGNVTIPRQSAAATAYWLANEATDITESQQTFVQMSLTPKNCGAYTEISRQLLLQASPGAEGIVSDDLAQVVAIAADLAALEGSGAAGQPTGLANTAGIGNVAAGAASYAKVLEFQTDVATANVRPLRGGYVTHPDTAAILMQKQRFTSTDTPLWNGNVWDGEMSGFPAKATNQLAAGVVDFGDWQELVIGEWGVLEVEVNPYANFKAGIIGVRAIYSLDVGIRRPFAFSRATGITA
jgi:HK97 family phage major capsid protein